METKYDIKKTYLRLSLGVLLLYALVAAVAYVHLIKSKGQSVDLYRVEISRVERLLPADPKNIDLSEFETIRSVSVYEGDPGKQSTELDHFLDPDSTYVIR